MTTDEILAELKSLAKPHATAGMERFGIRVANAYGISVPQLRALARRVGKNHNVAQALWTTGIHEARLLATMVDDPKQVTDAQMERWARAFDSWDICDGACQNLFDRTPFAYRKAIEWSERQEEFVKRAGFALMAYLAVHDKQAKDSAFTAFLPIIRREANDGRNFVRKAVNWALRGIGKRNLKLNHLAIKTAAEIRRMDSSTARWIAADALRELKSDAVQRKVARAGARTRREKTRT
jgi:3-methyladenine DNA glycosylase AlkD